jgi:hypothetical protein
MQDSPQGGEVPAVAEKEPLQGLAQILPQVDVIDDLDRPWGAVPNPLGRKPTSIPADDRDTRVHLHPLCNRGGRAHREQINDLMALEITHEDPNASASPPVSSTETGRS